jgi:hypothetical protein
MTRTALVLTSLVIWCAVGSAAPAPKEKAEAPYYPTTVGDRRVYESRTRSGKSEWTEVVTKVETKDKVTRVSVGLEREKKVEPFAVIEVSDAEIVRASGSGAVGPPKVLLKLPLKAGASWSWELVTENKGSFKEVFTFVGEEEIEVPAGKFKAARVDVAFEVNGKIAKRTQTLWYARGVGLVKDRFESSNGEKVTELKSVTTGK